MPQEQARAVIAVSGGADSCALLLACDEIAMSGRLKINFHVAHLDHGLRGEAACADAQFVGDLANRFGFDATIGCADVAARARRTRDNLEQAARRARYQFLAHVAAAQDARLILTAHTSDDQAETFLLRLLRGSGAEGLGGIKPVQEFRISDFGFRFDDSQISESEIRVSTFIPQISNPEDQQSKIENQNSEIENHKLVFINRKSKTENQSADRLRLVRPLLSWARRVQTVDYCRARGVEFRADAMNDDLGFARVRVRRELIPALETFNPRAVETLNRTAELLRADDDALRARAVSLLASARFDDGDSPSLKVDALRAAAPAVRVRVLRLWLAGVRGNLRRLERVHLKAIEGLLEGERGARTAELPGGSRVVRRRGWLVFLKRDDSSLAKTE